MVFSVCLNLLRNHAQAEDASQDVFLQVYHSAEKFRFESKTSSWLYRIAVNRSLNLIRSNRRNQPLQRTGYLEIDRATELEGSSNENVVSPDRAFEESTRRELLLNAIDSLPIKQRVPLILNKLQGFSAQEISEILDVSRATVEARLHRAKENLKNRLLQSLQ